jgi:hypothetical protein
MQLAVYTINSSLLSYHLNKLLILIVIIIAYIIFNRILITIIYSFSYYNLLLLLSVCMTAICYFQIILNTNNGKYH